MKAFERFVEVITLMAENFGAKVSEARLRLLWAELKGYGTEKIERAAVALMRKRKAPGFPTLAEWLEEMDGGAEIKAALASKEAFNALWEDGPDIPRLRWRDPLIPAVINAMGGWIDQAREVARIGSLRESQIQEGIWRRRFEAFYRALSVNPEGAQYALKGLIGEENETAGYITDKSGNPVWDGSKFLMRCDRMALASGDEQTNGTPQKGGGK